jgi:hypothetical protein
MSLFKIACIKYVPNPVPFQNKVYLRNDLLNMQSGIQFLIKHSMGEQNQNVSNTEILLDNFKSQNKDIVIPTPLVDNSRLSTRSGRKLSAKDR